jgi:triacylglycerol esterase/lipase EstA (alpha/beta hydrolase family)
MSDRLVALLVAATLLATLACATPVGVRRVDEKAVHRTLTATVLSTGKPSVASRQVLLRLGLFDRFEDDPEGTLAELHAQTLEEMDASRLFALAEYSFLHARKTRQRPYLVAASIYAYAYLFPEDGSAAPHPLDPRLRTAVDLYNRSIASALVSDRGEVTLREGSFPFHLGTLELEIDPQGLRWADRRLTNFVSAAELEVRGLRNRYRRAGIGAPFIAEAVAEEGRSVEAEYARLAENVKVPVTFFMRYADARAGLRTGRLVATLEVYSEDAATEIEVAGRRVPLEYETTSALAYTLERSRLWDFEIAGYLRGDILEVDDGLFMLRPYVPGRIPVVLVHGTASSPARWAEMLNELDSEPRISERYQIWFFMYTTGNPVLYSASLLRESLRRAVDELDPHGRDAALKEMVVIGHSQGGLLTKLQVIPSGDRFWQNLSATPLDELSLEPETRELLGQALFFEPQPFVKRVVFISTPHRGSFLAGNWLGRIASNLFTAPQNLVGTGLDLARAGVGAAGSTVDLARSGVDRARGDEDAQLRRRVARIPSSVDNMDPEHPFIRTLSSVPVDSGVVAHSIIPVRGGPPPEGQNDGVVEYASAHIDEAASEYVVYHSDHSTQSHPETIQEVRRILLEHLEPGD